MDFKSEKGQILIESAIWSLSLVGIFLMILQIGEKYPNKMKKYQHGKELKNEITRYHQN